jgi:exonuclease SbcC
MLITRIELENIKSYRHIVVDLRQGTTAISGANGAGKTTLVEAIGFALFGYLPYNQEQFVREGEKAGKVVINLIGSDERPYTVERRCGTGARWLVHDEEADMRLEQRADVLDKLHEVFGIDRERPLDSLFRDALGVPQGTFTAIFLEPASKRKQTFDTLLQIEDYKTAADNLLETQHHYRDQLRDQQGVIDRLAFETRELESWREQLHNARRLDEEQKQRHIAISQRIVQQEARKQQLDEQAARLTQLEGQQRDAQTRHDHAQTLLNERRQTLQKAQAAHDIITNSQDDYLRYQQAQEALRSLRLDANKRDILRQQRATHHTTRVQINTQIQNWHERLNEVASARQRIVELAPLVERQSELEHQRDTTSQQVQRYQAILATGNKLKAQNEKLSRELDQCQQKISAIEPLLPVAQLLEERTEHYNQLRIQSSQYEEKQRQLQEKRVLLKERQAERPPLAEQLRKAENSLVYIDKHRSEAEEMPTLQQENERLEALKNRLEGNIEGYARSRAQSAGGQCPLLNESCLNIRQHGTASLEAYFENLLTAEKAQLVKISNQQNKVNQHIEKIKQYADALNQIDRYIERRDLRAESLQRCEADIERLEREITVLTAELEQLTQAAQQLKQSERALQESKQADSKVRELNVLLQRRTQLQEQKEQIDKELQELRTEASQLKDSETQLKELQATLAALNDPRAQSREQQNIVARETDFQQQLLNQQLKLQETEHALQQLETELAVYDTLDKDIAQQELLSQQCAAGHIRYQQNINEAQTLHERQHAYQSQQQLTLEAEQRLQEISKAYEQAHLAFDEQELIVLRNELEQLKKDQIELGQQIQAQQDHIHKLEKLIEEAEALRVQLETAQQEYQTLEELQKMLEQFRKLIKEAAPHVLRAILADISAEANRIFGEIMGDRSAQLSWRNDYEVILRRQGVDRSFAQLSGGEQMSAALAVRLALLKKLSTLNIAFFDEPTQNMDELRRMNLAEQIRRVRGFDQLIVISHDDTFEQGLDSLIRLNKANGETRLIEEDGALPPAEIGQAWQSRTPSPSLLQTTN